MRDIVEDESEIDDVLGTFWLQMVEDDMRWLRAFTPSRNASLLNWLTIHLSHLAHEQLRKLKRHRKRTVFPSETGTLRVPSSLQKAWPSALKAAGIKRGLTVHGLRRTFNDLARRAGVYAIVTRSMTGHVTEKMQEHYSSVGMDEKRSAMTNVVKLVRGGAAEAEPGRMRRRSAGPRRRRAERGAVEQGGGALPHTSSADAGADAVQIQQRPVGLGGTNRA